MHRPLNSRFIFTADLEAIGIHLLRVILYIPQDNGKSNQCDQCFFHNHKDFENGDCGNERIEKQTGACENPNVYFKLIKSKITKKK